MQRLFNAAALEGGYYNTAALEGGAYNTAALVGGSDLYDDAAVIGGFALASLASADSPPSASELINFGQQTLLSLPPTVRDTIAKMFNPQSDSAKQKIYAALALLYLLDSLKAITIAPELDLATRKMARQRWVLTQRYLQSLNPEIRTIYTRLLRYIHIPHHCPRACKRMRDRWISTINNRTRPWGRSAAYHGLPQMPSTKKYDAAATWSGDYLGPPMAATPPGSKKKGGKRKRTTTSRAPAAKRARAANYTGWDDPSGWTVDGVIPAWGTPNAAANAAATSNQEHPHND